MKLPDAELARIDPGKVAGYLLSTTHPVGRAKAVFFRDLGYGPGRAAALLDALKGIARTGDVTASVVTPHGKEYMVDGRLDSPTGSAGELRTIWIVEAGSRAPRFVTAYPP